MKTRTALVAGLVALASLARAQSPATSDPTPGSLGTLVVEAITPASQSRVIQGLTSEHPPVRAAAARVAFALGMRGLLPQMLAALTSENDDEAALEQSRFVAAFGSPDDPVLVSAMTRTSPRVSRQITALRARAANAVATVPAPTPGPAGAGTPGPLLRLAAGYPREFVRSVLETARCNVGEQKGAGAGARVSLRPDGRVSRVTLVETPPSKECARAAQALMVTYVAAPDRRLDAEEMLVFPFQPDFIACQDTGTVGTPERLGTRGAAIQPPEQVYKVQPQYPLSAQSDRVKGIVILEAMISPAGCVVSAQVLRSVDLRLDWAALRAVAQWRYTPTLVNGVPTQIVMTVTVTFNLN